MADSMLTTPFERLKWLKRVAYVPFLWAFTWFGYWAIYDTFFLGKPPLGAGIWNYLGAAVSLVLLLKTAAALMDGQVESSIPFAVVRAFKKGLSLCGVRSKSVVREITNPGHLFKAVEPVVPISGPIVKEASVSEAGIEPAGLPNKEIQYASLVNTIPSKKRTRRVNPKGILETGKSIGECRKFGGDRGDCFVCPDLITCTHRRINANNLKD